MKYLPLTLAFLASLSLKAETAKVPTEPIRLLDDSSFEDFTFFLNSERSLTDNLEEIWSLIDEGMLQVTGKGWGYLRTNTKYRDYHLVLEYKWGEHTVGIRADRSRDNGLLIHAYGEDGGHTGTWMSSIEAQLIEGGSGDILVLAGTNNEGVKAPTRATSNVRLDRDGETVWSPDGDTRTFPPAERRSSRINWRDRDPDWTDIKGFRGEEDIENPVGEWNRMEVVCRGDTIRIFLNGELVNQCRDVYPSEGFICIQSEGAEILVRRFELWPLDSFTETWEPVLASTNTGASETGESLLPRRFPWSPEESLAAWQVEGNYGIELVAAEPIVCDPVDLVWDEQGRMFVAEMRDYPLPAESGPLLSRIRQLSDEDGDGRMDKATTWADQLDHVQGMLPINGGLLVTSRTAILFLKDHDGDGVVDERRTLSTSNEPRHNQLQVSSPRWGLDNAIYLNNGLDGMQIYPGDSPEAMLSFRGWDLRYDPRNNQLSTSTGRGQFGASFDDWGRRFFCSNRNPIMFAVMPADAMERNPFAGITKGYEDVHPKAAPIRPIRISHTTSATHLGTFTSACGLAVYRGDWMPEMRGDIFVCDPTGQLVTRNRLLPKGASFTSERIGRKYEFLASSDEWCRPVQVRNGPDGALYICDMYRRFIDHSRFFPDAFVETHYMRAGLDHGRIWRLVPKNAALRKVQPLPASSSELVKLLENENAWQRIHAQRLLVENKVMDAIPAINELLKTSNSARGRLHALWTLHGLGALSDAQIARALRDPESGIVENTITLAEVEGHKDDLLNLAAHTSSRVSFLAALALGSSPVSSSELPEAFLTLLASDGLADPWIRKAILTATQPLSARLLVTLLERVESKGRIPGGTSEDLADFVREFAAEAAARGDLQALRLIATQVKPGNPRLTDASIVEGLILGLKRGSLSNPSISSMLSEPPTPLTREDLVGIEVILKSAATIALDRSKPIGERLATLPLVREQGKQRVLAVAKLLIDQNEPPQIQTAACRMMSGLNRREVAQYFFDQWNSLGPIPRREALELLTANEDTAIQLMRRMQKGEINRSLMPAFQRWALVRSENQEVVRLAQELFGSIDQDRAKVVADYSAALTQHSGNPVRGRSVFEKAACHTCHRYGGVGVDVGPGLADIRFKPPVALLTDLLDPNRAAEERWSVYTVKTQNGKTFTGLIAAETTAALEIRLPGGHSETVPRNQIESLETTGASLMPVGLEGLISKPEMADLIAFLTTQ